MARGQPSKAAVMASLGNMLVPGLETEADLYNPSLKALYHKQNLSLFLQGRFDEIEPVTAEIVPSLECCFGCPLCTYSQNRSKGKPRHKGRPRLMTLDLFNSILDGLDDMYTRGVIITGGGEPTLHPEWLDFVKSATRRGFHVGLYTNGSQLDRDAAMRVMQLEPDFVRVSLNAGSSDTHSRMHGLSDGSPAMFERVVNGIGQLAAAKTQLGARTTLGIGFIMGARNSSDGDLDAIVTTVASLASQAGGSLDYVAFRPEVMYFDASLRPARNQPHSQLLAGLPRRLKEAFASLSSETSPNVLIGEGAFKELSEAPAAPARPNIATPWSTSFDFDGRLHITSERNGMPEFSVPLPEGSATSEDSLCGSSVVSDIWFSSRRVHLAREMAEGRVEPLPYYKLKPLNDLLWDFREVLGDQYLSADEASSLLGGLPEGRRAIPDHTWFI